MLKPGHARLQHLSSLLLASALPGVWSARVYWHDFDYWLRKEAKRAENQSKSNVVVVDLSKSGSFAKGGNKRYLEVSGVCTPFVNHETNSNLDFNYEPELSATML